MSDEERDLRVRVQLGPVAGAFFQADDFTTGIMGPFGSGKSTAAVMRCIHRSRIQHVSPDGRRKARGVVVRNTYRELLDTTCKTFFDWVPPTADGKRTWRVSDMEYLIRDGDLDLEILFRALDRPEHIKKLLSLDLTWAWVNEAREVPLTIIEGLQGRLGRYPSMRMGGPSWFGMWMDTNPPDTDHWWPKHFETLKTEGWRLFKQPSGLSPQAENLSNLPPGYYTRLMAGKKTEYIKVYIKGEYGFVIDGKPVYSEYSDGIHVADDLPVIQGRKLLVGIDASGLTPAAIACQTDAMGRLRCLKEYLGDSIGAGNFSQLLRTKLAEDFGAALGPEFEIEMWGDPAGAKPAGSDEKTYFTYLEAAGFSPRPAPTNLFTPRREAVAMLLSRLIEGTPGILISGSGCPTLRKGFMGGYQFGRVQVANDERYQDEPVKNAYSHPHDSLQYVALGIGAGPAIIQQKKARDPIREARRRLRRHRSPMAG